MSNIGTCALCCKHKELKESHIIPGFVWRWLKNSSVTGYFRKGETPNLRQQDGYKIFLLCFDCEQRFGRWENEFARNVFVPINRGDELGDYGTWLLKFAASVSWRVLTFYKRKAHLNHFDSHLRTLSDKALEVWREFLLDKRPHPGKFQQHILPWPGLIGNQSDPNMPVNINQYILRSVDIDAACSKNEAFIYTKMGRVFLIGFINMLSPNHWRDTKIHVVSGSLRTKHWTLPPAFPNFVYYKAHRARKSQQKISERQWIRIESDYKKNAEKSADSEMFKAITQDSILFGEVALDDNGIVD